ncbi:canalicular multispecific organic anion transporter 2-like isoform X2 [Varroa jacobsoni]|nr:canalicular multispecific organic anion transporter 2-like isoform X2 [Varroa destructor]XP_022686681.1 canalicular multispecific organic anion transporter 2-like isoform X2 [Varroa jacobsoni]
MWNTTNPELTRCFQDTVLIWVPCAALFVFAVIEAFAGQGRTLRLPWTTLNFTKIVICTILAFVQMCELWNVISQPLTYFRSELWSPIVQLVTIFFAATFIMYQKNRGQVTSASLFAFWFLYTIATGIRYRTAMNAAFLPNAPQLATTDKLRFTLAVIAFGLSSVQLTLSCFADRRLSHLIDKHRRNQCPEKDASFLSSLVFWWFNRMIALGYERASKKSGLYLEDVWALDEDNTTETIVRKFLPYYNSEKKKNKADGSSKQGREDGTPVLKSQLNILYPLLKTFGLPLLGTAVIKLVVSLITFVAPVILNSLITFVQTDEPAWKGVFLATVMLSSLMAESLLNNQYEYRLYRISMQVRSAIIHAIYVKALTLSGYARGQYTTGEIVNLMSVDTQRIMDQVNMMNMLWSIPLQIGISIWMLWQQLGIATLGGVFVMILLMPVNAVVTILLRKYQVSLMRNKDKRTKLMNEILSGIKVLKLYAWETSFMRRIDNLRNKELESLRKQAWLSGFMVFAFTSAPFLVSLASFATHVLSDPANVLDANKAFVSLSLFNILKLPMAFLPMLVSFTAMFFVSLNRVNKYLRSDELDKDAVQRIKGAASAISIRNGTFQYAADAETPTLQDINMEIKHGQLIAIVGTVGTGKTTLLGALMGEVVKKSGNVTVSGSVAYVPQQAWIQGTSIKNNILFGNKFDRARYEQVLDTCALRPDLEMLPGGDETEVGEKGINLSGGQKQRISLARAVYAQRDIYYFDDPLAAVDSQVSKHIFDKVISNTGILAGKTRILVTHRLSVLNSCDVVYVLKDGRISEWGTYKELVARKGAFSDFLMQHFQDKAPDEEIPEEDLKAMEEIVKGGAAPPQLVKQISIVSGGESDGGSELGSLRRKTSTTRTVSTASSIKSIKPRDSKQNLAGGAEESKNRPGAALTKDEEAQVGSVNWKVYRDYIVAMGLVGSMVTLIAFIMGNVFNILTSIWLSKWSEDAIDPELANSIAQRDYRLGLYAMWGAGETMFALIASISLNLIALEGGRVLHERMVQRVLRAPMSFFDTTPMGRVLNRFSKDIDAADITMRFNLRMAIQQSFRTIASLTLISMQTPVFLVLVLPLGIIYYYVQKYYISTSRQLKRIDSTSRSPIYMHFSETLTGCTSIRAYGAEGRFIALSNLKTDINHSAYYPSLAASRWLSVRLEFLGYVIVFLASLLAALARDVLTPGLAGLSISYALTITGTLNMLVKSTSDVETNFVSIERCLEYADIEVEADWVVESNRPEFNWPQEGAIQFHDYSTRYRDGLPLVVKDINVQMNPGEKVGVVGRTGAGKSSLTLSLFRLIEAASGYIVIDGINISRIGLHDLRSKLTIIPQDPVLFSGTLRENLDPFEEHTDESIWAVLEQAHLKSFITELDKSLLFEVTEGGENMSVGQRQLVCLARALLRKTKILILDEATAAVDVETDDLIQKTLKQEFSDSTTLTIAHRLNTIIDHNKVMVMSDGLVVEYENPQVLLKKQDSLFYAMAKDAGLV